MEIRKATEADEIDVRELFAICFGKDFSYEKWAWKYKYSPWGSTAVVALDKNKIIAHYGGLKTNFFYKGSSFISYQPCDVMTHPKYRARFFSKKGAIIKTGEFFFANNQMDFAFGFPSERHAILGTKQLGYTKHSYVSILRKQLNMNKIIWHPFIKIETEWSCLKAYELDSLWESVKNDNNLSIIKNSSYIFWRYRDNPLGHYKPIIIRSSFQKTLKAFGVYYIKGNELLLLELLFIKKFDINKLIKLLESLTLKKGLNNMQLWLNPEENFCKIMIKKGYTIENGVPLLFKILNEKLDAQFLFKNYFYSMGDYDAT